MRVSIRIRETLNTKILIGEPGYRWLAYHVCMIPHRKFHENL